MLPLNDRGPNPIQLPRANAATMQPEARKQTIPYLEEAFMTALSPYGAAYTPLAWPHQCWNIG